MTTTKRHPQIFTGNSNIPLVSDIIAAMNDHTFRVRGADAMKLGDATVKRFADGEVSVVFHDDVRGGDVYVVQPLCGTETMSVNDSLMEMLTMVDALRRASAGSITAVVPYYCYARQDRKVAPRTPITSKLVADLLIASGIHRIVTVELHAPQIQGFFNIPSDHLFAMPTLLPELESWRGCTVVSPDAGGVERARAYAKRLGADLAIIDKRRERANESEVMNIIGDVKHARCLILDDMIDTAGTLCNGAVALMKHGAESVSAAAVHGVFSGPAAARIAASPLDRVIVTNSIPMSKAVHATGKVSQANLGPLLGKVIHHIHTGTSVSALFV